MLKPSISVITGSPETEILNSNYPLISSKKGCLMASLIVRRLLGLNVNDFSRKSTASSGIKLKIFLKGFF